MIRLTRISLSSSVNFFLRWCYRLVFQESIFVAVCAMALCWQTDYLLDSQPRWSLYVFVGAATLAMYQLYQLAERLSKMELSLSCWNSFRARIMFILGLIGLTAWCWWLTDVSLGWFMLSVLASTLYTLPLFSTHLSISWRRLGVFKTLLLAGIWTLVTWWFPLLGREDAWQDAAWVLGMQRLVWMLVLCLIFDQRDAAHDRRAGRFSIATVVDAKWLDAIVVCCLILLWVLHHVAFQAGLLDTGYASWQGLTVLLAGVFLYHRLRKPATWFYLVWVDGMMLLLALISFI